MEKPGGGPAAARDADGDDFFVPIQERLGAPTRAAIAAAAVAAYALAFVPAFEVIGAAVGAFYALPVVVAGWLLGRRGGVVAAVAGTPLNYFLYVVVVGFQTNGFLGQIGAGMANIITGYFVGGWSETHRSLRSQRAELHRSQQRFQLAAAATHDVIFDFDFKTGRAWTNDEFYRSSGLAPGLPPSFDTWIATIHPEDRQKTADAWQRAVAGGEDRFVAEYRVLGTDGRVVHMLSRAFILRSGGVPVRAVGAASDITPLKELERRAREEVEGRERQLREMNEFKTQLLNMAAHELNTPISALRLQLYNLRLGVNGNATPNQTKALDVLDRNVDRLANLVRETLDVARLQSGRLMLNVQRVALRTVVDEAIATFGPLAQSSHIELRVQVPEGLAVLADPGRISQVVFNLVGNALKFTPPGGRVAVSASPTPTGIRLEVRDTGIGLDADQLGRLFKPFSQVHAPGAVAAKGGTGLGLFICKGIVEGHGGRIWAESDGPGRGTRFALELPAEARAVVGRASPPLVEAVTAA